MKKLGNSLKSRTGFFNRSRKTRTLTEIMLDSEDLDTEPLLSGYDDNLVAPISRRQDFITTLDRISYRLFVKITPQQFQYWLLVNLELMSRPIGDTNEYLQAIGFDADALNEIGEIEIENLQRLLKSTIFDRIISAVFLEDPLKKCALSQLILSFYYL